MVHNYRWRLSLADGERCYGRFEERLATLPVIEVPTITLDAEPDPFTSPGGGSSYRDRFTDAYERRTPRGIGHNLPWEASSACARAVANVGRFRAIDCVTCLTGDAVAATLVSAERHGVMRERQPIERRPTVSTKTAVNTRTAVNTEATADTENAAITENALSTKSALRTEDTEDSAAAARHERFGKLPERVPYQDMVEVKPASPREPGRDGCDPEGSWMSFSCLAADLGL